MKKSRFLVLIATIVMGLSFVSCDNEPIDPALLLENPDVDPEFCAAPALFSASEFIDGSKVTLNWDGDGGAWQIQYGPEGFALGSGTAITATDDSITITGLTSTNEYDFYIRTTCGAEEFSEWIGPVSVGTVIVNTCALPSGITAARSNDTTVNVVWFASSGATQWEVQYGTTGFALGSGTILSTNVPTAQITGLLANRSYDFYVRTVCSPTSSSTWAGPVPVNAVGTNPVTTGDYWPTAINNSWTYDLNGTSEQVIRIASLDNVSGNSYYTLNAPVTGGASATQRIRKANGNYFMKIESITTPAQNGLPPSVTTGNETIVLKDNVAVGDSWTDTYVQSTTYEGLPSISLNFSITCTILEKGSSVTVRGVVYNEVIKLKRVQTITGVAPSTNTAYYWYAKGVGPVKIENDNYYQDLKSYTLN